MIDREKAIAQLSQIRVRGNEDGLIPSFNVLVNYLPFHFWNSFSEKILKKAQGDDSLYREVEAGLETAAAECGYHTGYGIINSEEFKSIIGPMIQNEPEDILHGAYAVFTAWGWADAAITELSSSRMVVRAKDYYEADISDTFRVDKPFAYMIRGVSRAFMDLGYGKTYPDGFGTYECVQTKAKELGDSFGEFIVTRRAG